MPAERLRVALVAGTLAQGGAEKQLVYMVRALVAADVDVRVYCLAEGEHYAAAVRSLVGGPVWIGRRAAPPVRLLALIRELQPFRPHVVQAGHFYVNLYVWAAAKVCGALSIGSIRGDGTIDVRGAGLWGRWLVRAPRMLIVNSHSARRYAVHQGVDPAAIRVIAGVLDASAVSPPGKTRPADGPAASIVAVSVASLIEAKRLDRFLGALAKARRSLPTLRGVIAGEGPERGRLEAMASTLGLGADGVCFAGHCADVPSLLASADLLVLTSDHEGCPNVLLEAMAAGLPVVTTPAGDAAMLVTDGATGFVVDFNDEDALAERIVRLARSPGLRACLGAAGRERALRDFRADALADRLLAAYRAGATRMGGTGRVAMLSQLALTGLEDHVDAEFGPR